MPFDLRKIDFETIGIAGLDALAIIALCYVVAILFKEATKEKFVTPAIHDKETKDKIIKRNLKCLWSFVFLFTFILFPAVTFISIRYVYGSLEHSSAQTSSLTVDKDDKGKLLKNGTVYQGTKQKSVEAVGD